VTSCINFHGHDVFLIPSKQGTYLIYGPTLRKLLRITDGLALRISESGLCDETNDGGVVGVRSLLQQSLDKAIKPVKPQVRKSKFFHLALGLTKNCTLSCLYCHADAGQKEEMPIGVLSRAIDYAFRTAQRNDLRGINISFAVGGEPTTNWRLFTSCIGQIKECEQRLGIPAHLSITTNGYYRSPKRVFLARELHNILLSLDGPADVQNFHRPTRNNRGSYAVVRQSALYFKEHAKSFAIRSTVSNYSVKRMPEIVQFFYDEFGNRYDLVFEPLVPLGRAAANVAVVSGPSQEDFVNYYIQAKELGKKLGIQVTTSAANCRRLVTSFCGAMSIPSFTVTVRGVITTCERDSDGTNYWYGRFPPELADPSLDESRMEHNRALLEMPEKCHDCFCKWHCAGDCPDVRTIGYDRCSVNRCLVQYELESILDHTGA
jgi:uncharacterized protein